MREMISNAKTDELRVLKDAMLESKSLTDTQIDIICDIVDELIDRGEISTPPAEDVRESYLRLLEDSGHDLPEDLSEKWEGQNDTLSGRDIEAPKVKPKIRRRLSRFRRIALVAASFIGILLLFMTVISVVTGFDFWGAFIKRTPDAVHVVVGEQDDVVVEMDIAYLRLKDVLNALGIKVNLPKRIPDDFEFYFIEPEEPKDYLPIIAWFIRGNETLSIHITPMGKTKNASENNDEEQSKFYKGKYLVDSNMDRWFALWVQYGYEIRIQGDISYDELIEMLDSI